MPDQTVRRVVLGQEPLEFRLSLTGEELEARRVAGEQVVPLTGAGPMLLLEDEMADRAPQVCRRFRVAPGVELRIRRRISEKQARVLRLMARTIPATLED